MHRPLLLPTLALLAVAGCHAREKAPEVELSYAEAIEIAMRQAPSANKRFDWTLELFQAWILEGREAEAHTLLLDACAEFSFRPRIEDFDALLTFATRHQDVATTEFLFDLLDQELPFAECSAEWTDTPCVSGGPI